METQHRIFYADSRNMESVQSESVDLVVTSPPYPMIEMWDIMFACQDDGIALALENADGPAAFERMHRILDGVWAELRRVSKPGGIVCVNIGDATRTVGGQFSLFANHARIQSRMLELGFRSLPAILWRKQTNAPNKFMGSGMLPPGAYVTLEHEYILVFRNGGKREFKTEAEKKLRRQSAYFWEERNAWFSDVWTDLKGTGQELVEKDARARSGAFPLELAFRLIHMFSVKNDLVLDPFTGVGTTVFAAMAAGRNSLGHEIDPGLQKTVSSKIPAVVSISEKKTEERLRNHISFVQDRFLQKGAFKHRNIHYGFPVVTTQEKELVLHTAESVENMDENAWRVEYRKKSAEKFVWDRENFFSNSPESDRPNKKKRPQIMTQSKMFD